MMKGQLRKYGLIAGLIAMGIFGLPLIASDQAEAALGQVRVYPNSDISHNNWGAESGRGNRWSNVNRLTNDPRPSENNWICSTANTASVRFGVGGGSNGVAAPLPSVQQGVTRIVQAQTVGKAGYKRFDLLQPRMQLSVSVGGSTVATSNSETWIGAGGVLTEPQCGTNGDLWSGWHAATIANYVVASGQEWTQQQLETMELVLNRQAPPVGSTARAVRVMALNALLEYVTYSTLTQNGYQFYRASSSINPSASDVINASAANTPKVHNYAEGGDSRNFRLRMAVRTTDERWLQQYGEYRLQYGFKQPDGQCSSVSEWFPADNTSGSIRLEPHAGVANGATIGVAASQPSPGGSAAHQTHVNGGTFKKHTEVAQNDFAMWDFALRYYGSAPVQTFCFQIVNADGNTQPLNHYTNYPEITLTNLDGAFGVGIVSDDSGTPVVSPVVSFPSLPFSRECRQNNATLGTNNQRIRVTDNRISGGWTLSIAPTAGASAKWQGGAPANSYSFNSATGSPPGCQDGRLGLNLGAVVAAPKAGCSGAGLYTNPSAAFAGGTPITIGGSSGGTDRGCYWGIMNIGLEQQIPADTPADTYSLPMTITLTSS